MQAMQACRVAPEGAVLPCIDVLDMNPACMSSGGSHDGDSLREWTLTFLKLVRVSNPGHYKTGSTQLATQSRQVLTGQITASTLIAHPQVGVPQHTFVKVDCNGQSFVLPKDCLCRHPAGKTASTSFFVERHPFQTGAVNSHKRCKIGTLQMHIESDDTNSDSEAAPLRVEAEMYTSIKQGTCAQIWQRTMQEQNASFVKGSILAKKSCDLHGMDLGLFIQLTNIPLRDCSAVRWTLQKIVNAGCGVVYFGQSPGIFIVPVFADGEDETMFVCDGGALCHMWVLLKDQAAKIFFLTGLQVYASIDQNVELKNVSVVERDLSDDANMAQGMAMAFCGKHNIWETGQHHCRICCLMRCSAFRVDVVGCTNTTCWSQRRQARNSCFSIANQKTKANGLTHKQFEVLTFAARTGVASAEFLQFLSLPVNLPVRWFLALHREFSRGSASGAWKLASPLTGLFSDQPGTVDYDAQLPFSQAVDDQAHVQEPADDQQHAENVSGPGIKRGAAMTHLLALTSNEAASSERIKKIKNAFV
jgi:hypothetical protein